MWVSIILSTEGLNRTEGQKAEEGGVYSFFLLHYIREEYLNSCPVLGLGSYNISDLSSRVFEFGLNYATGSLWSVACPEQIVGSSQSPLSSEPIHHYRI